MSRINLQAIRKDNALLPEILQTDFNPDATHGILLRLILAQSAACPGDPSGVRHPSAGNLMKRYFSVTKPGQGEERARGTLAGPSLRRRVARSSVNPARKADRPERPALLRWGIANGEPPFVSLSGQAGKTH
jgi:hypothetical protein